MEKNISDCSLEVELFATAPQQPSLVAYLNSLSSSIICMPCSKSALPFCPADAK
jgi:hypothetical protein